METNSFDVSLENLKSILIRLNKQKNTRNERKKLFNVDKILSVNTSNCVYVGNGDKKINKQFLHVKFTSLDEIGTICLSVSLDKYEDLL
jgi:hypothetical protein